MSNADRALAGSVAPGNQNRGQICPTCPYVQQRSSADHGMFWATINTACKTWPHNHPFQPTGATKEDRTNSLYGWLLVEVGYVDVGDLQSHEVAAVNFGLETARRVIKRGKKLHYWRVAPTDTGWQLITPRSLDYLSAGKRQFEDVRSAVYDVIESVLGVPVETLKREARQEAA